MRVLYISTPPFFDYDLSFVGHLKEHCEITYLLDLAPYHLESSALSIKSNLPVAGIFQGKEFNELNAFDKFIPLDNFYVINRISKKALSRSNLKLQKEIIKFIDKLNPDLIHFGTLLNWNYLAFLFLNKKKVVLTLHDPFPHSGEHSFINMSIRKLNFSFIKNIILLNDHQKKKFLAKTPIFRFNHVLNSKLGIYEYLKEYKVSKYSSAKFRLLFFGRISKYKGVDDLLNAFTLIEMDFPDIELIIAGKGTYWFDIENYLKNPKVRILNRFIPNGELVELISNADLVVCPYKDATQSGVVMSSFALNKPVLATKVGGFLEMIEDGYTGFLVPPNDIIALSEKLKEIIKNKSRLKNIEKNILEEYSSGKNSWKVISKHLTENYRIITK
ncbi:glycosyltransferase family 4 protein [Sediminicola sp. 1XM1-17]|uniref:glycosyltransferase family 4 protein n=1 Tax=Sediminicola sp. 1XM1-17 TaxID=3127702 RepID=UPI003077FB70